MIENFKINSKEIDKIKKISKQEKDFRIDNLNLFNKKGFPDFVYLGQVTKWVRAIKYD